MTKFFAIAFDMGSWRILTRKKDFKMQKLVVELILLSQFWKSVCNSNIRAWAVEFMPWSDCVNLVIFGWETSIWWQSSKNRELIGFVWILFVIFLNEIHQSSGISLNVSKITLIEPQSNLVVTSLSSVCFH